MHANSVPVPAQLLQKSFTLTGRVSLPASTAMYTASAPVVGRLAVDPLRLSFANETTVRCEVRSGPSHSGRPCWDHDFVWSAEVGSSGQNPKLRMYCLYNHSVSLGRRASGLSRRFTSLPLAISPSKRRGHMDGTPLSKHQFAVWVETNGPSCEISLKDEKSSSKNYVWPDAKRPKICVLGGGFGGLYTALQLESLMWPADKKPQVVVVDQSERFVFKPMMYELLSKEVDLWEVAPSFKELLASTSIQFQQDRLERILPSDGSKPSDIGTLKANGMSGMVFLESGLVIDYDWLVLALGSKSQREVVPGAVDYALPFSSLEDVLEVDKRLRILERKQFGRENPLIRVIVVGAGYCGIELAATLAERLGERGKVQVVDVTSDICPSAPPGNRDAAYKVLKSRNVELTLGFLASSIRKEPLDQDTSRGCSSYVVDLRPANKAPRRFSTSDTTSLHADLILWTVGSKPALSSEAIHADGRPFPLSGRGQVEIDEYLRVKGHPRIFAIGDSAYLRDSSGRPVPTTAQVAFQEADYAGWNIWAAINDRPPLPFRFQNLGELMTLGKNDAAMTLSFIDGLTLDGPLAHTARKLAYLYRLPTNEHRLKVGVSWFAKSAVDGLAMVQDRVTRFVAASS